jgi:DGQHR domain-containing protein
MAKSKTKNKKFTYQALQYSQRGTSGAPTFLVFHASASEIVEWADVDRLKPENRTGAQRPLRDLKVAKVAKFFRVNPKNTIPTAVVIALDKKAVTFKGSADRRGIGEHGSITILKTGQEKPGLIIDGQHRAFGANKLTEPVHLNIVAFLGGDDSERAFQFVVINNSATRVSKDHIKALNLNFDKDQLNKRLIDSSGLALGMNDEKYGDLQAVDGSEPFKGMLQWPNNPDGYVPPSAIESALAETRDRASLLGIEEFERDVFLSIWSIVKDIRASVWQRLPASRLLQKVSIYALTVYILESMVGLQRNADSPIDFMEEGVLETQVKRVVERIPEEFWRAEWTLKELDTGSGRQKLVESLQIIDSNARFQRPWHDKVPLIDPALLSQPKPDASNKAVGTGPRTRPPKKKK